MITHESPENIIPSVELNTFICINKDEFKSTQISATFSFSKETTLSEFRKVLHGQYKQYMGLCKQVERLNENVRNNTPQQPRKKRLIK